MTRFKRGGIENRFSNNTHQKGRIRRATNSRYNNSSRAAAAEQQDFNIVIKNS